MKKTLASAISVVIVAVLMVLNVTLRDNFNLSNDFYNVSFWLAIPLASITICSLYLTKHLWLTLAVVLVLDVVLWLVAIGNIPFLDYGTNMEMIALLSLIIQQTITLIIVVGIYIFRYIKGRRLIKQ